MNSLMFSLENAYIVTFGSYHHHHHQRFILHMSVIQQFLCKTGSNINRVNPIPGLKKQGGSGTVSNANRVGYRVQKKRTGYNRVGYRVQVQTIPTLDPLTPIHKEVWAERELTWSLVAIYVSRHR